MKKFFGALIAGMALEYFLDPGRGSSRRQTLKGPIDSLAGSAGKVSQMAGPLKGAMPHGHDNDSPDDKTLKDRVESEVLRDPKFGRAPINFNVENGIVVIHGELPTQSDIDQLVSWVSSIRNVKGVENLLHLPGTPAPNKLSAIEAS
jgi:osmotically-inducible protein OsmY